MKSHRLFVDIVNGYPSLTDLLYRGRVKAKEFWALSRVPLFTAYEGFNLRSPNVSKLGLGDSNEVL